MSCRRSAFVLVPIKRGLLSSVILFCALADLSCSSLPETPEARTLSALAPKVVFLCDFATNSHASPESVSSWKALQDPSLDTGNLIRLLRSEDPKIRSLAIFALDHKNEPRVLPEIAALQSDRAPSYSCPEPFAGALPLDKPQTWPQQPGTVGGLAGEVVNRYLRESGYANFSDYWNEHKNRNYSVSWFALRLRRVWSFDHLNHPSMDVLRREIAQLPSPDRQWTVLWLGTLPSPNNVVRAYTEDDLVRNATELGHEALLQLLSGHFQSTDPDLRARQDSAYSESLQALQTFVLRHSSELFAETDREFLLQEKFGHFVWYSVGAAQLDRKNASHILHAAYERFDGNGDDYNRAVLVMALWNSERQQETRFILNWFYTTSMGAGLYATPRHQFLRDADEQKNAKPLIAALIRDPRFDTLEWNSLDDLTWMIARWTNQHSVGSYPESQARSEDPEVRDNALAEYRRRIRASIPLWLSHDR
jgi:hypothetical protein